VTHPQKRKNAVVELAKTRADRRSQRPPDLPVTTNNLRIEESSAAVLRDMRLVEKQGKLEIANKS
jgi:hypothetical protein